MVIAAQFGFAIFRSIDQGFVRWQSAPDILEPSHPCRARGLAGFKAVPPVRLEHPASVDLVDAVAPEANENPFVFVVLEYKAVHKSSLAMN